MDSEIEQVNSESQLRPNLLELTLYFLKLGATGFGGPVALSNYMQRDLVMKRGWISQEEYVEGFALAQLAPGPLAAQLAIYLGWVRYRVLGATLVGIAFVLPSFLMCVALAVAYIKFGRLQWLQSLFYSIGAAVIGIIVNSAYKLVRRTVGKDYVLFSVWAMSALVTAWLETEVLWLFLAAGIFVLILKGAFKWRAGNAAFFLLFPAWTFSGATGVASTTGTLWNIGVYFTKAGAFVFGSGLAIVPFLHSGVVQQYQWLNEKQFIDAVAVAMITPGPVVITVAFIGYLVAGLAGATTAALGTFLPCYLLTVIPAPYYSRIARYPSVKIFVEGVTAAAIGTIAGATWVLGKRAIIDAPTAVIAFVTLLLVLKTKIPEPLLILAAGGVGFLLKGV
ncbi:MAG: chromate efflux transporter [Bdellovibrionales bacterium]|nr:chromate efflux transporter [Bdellovibrionales bacterium]